MKRVLRAVIVLLCCACAGGTADAARRRAAGSGSKAWHRHPNSPLITASITNGLGANDPDVLWDAEENKWKMWYSGPSDEVGGKVRLTVGYAESADGVAWAVEGENRPALVLSDDPDAWDFSRVETPAVIKNPAAPPERRYILWYAGGNEKKTLATSHSGEYPYYQIGVAFSADGKTFTRLPAEESPYGKAGLLFTAADAFAHTEGVATGVVSDPDVVYKDGIFYMWYAGFAMNAKGEIIPGASGMCLATSRDGLRWEHSRKNPLTTLVRPENPLGPAQPSVLWNQRKQLFEMWFNDDTAEEIATLPEKLNGVTGYWYASSRDGVEWTTTYRAGRDLGWDRNQPNEAKGMVAGTEVVLKDGEYRMYYPAYSTRKVPPGWPIPYVVAISLATKPDK